MDRISIGPLSLAYKLEGLAAAPTVVFCNSLSTTHRMWDAQAKALGENFRILRFDARGHGQSDAPPGPYSTSDFARDLDGLLASLNIVQPIHLVGLSLGGMVAMNFAMLYPSRLASLALCATCASMKGAEAIWNRRIQTAQTHGTAAFAAETLGRWFTDDFKTAQPARFAAIAKDIGDCPDDGYAAACAAVRDVELSDRLTAIKVPTLCIAADQDPVTSADSLRELANKIPGAAKLVTIGPARHLVNVERPQEFTNALVEFWQTLPVA